MGVLWATSMVMAMEMGIFDIGKIILSSFKGDAGLGSDIIKPSDPRFAYVGRWQRAGDHYEADWPCSTLRMQVEVRGNEGAMMEILWYGLRTRISASIKALDARRQAQDTLPTVVPELKPCSFDKQQGFCTNSCESTAQQAGRCAAASGKPICCVGENPAVEDTGNHCSFDGKHGQCAASCNEWEEQQGGLCKGEVATQNVCCIWSIPPPQEQVKMNEEARPEQVWQGMEMDVFMLGSMTQKQRVRFKSAGSFVVDLTKMTEAEPMGTGVASSLLAASVFQFRGVVIDRLNANLTLVPLSRSARPKRSIDFIGASDTAGFCVDGSPSTSKAAWMGFGWQYSNCAKATPSILGRLLDADVSVQAIPGIGLTQNANANEKWQLGEKTIFDYFQRTLQSSAGRWTFPTRDSLGSASGVQGETQTSGDNVVDVSPSVWMGSGGRHKSEVVTPAVLSEMGVGGDGGFLSDGFGDSFSSIDGSGSGTGQKRLRSLSAEVGAEVAGTPDADLVVISIGGNDYNHQGGNVPAAEFHRAYERLLLAVFRDYGEGVVVVSICGQGDPLEASRDPDNNRCRPCAHVEQATNSFKQAHSSKDERTHYMFIPCDGTVVSGVGDIGCAGHKNSKGQRQVSEYLAPKLRTIMNW